MRLREEFVTVFNDESAITVSVDTKLFSGMIRSNETAAFIIKCLEKETSVDDIVEKICEEYNCDREIVKADVERVIEKLRSINALTD